MTTALDPPIASFGRWLRYENKSPNTVSIYLGAVRKLAGWLADRPPDTRPATWSQVTREHIRDFVIDVLDTRSAGYANNLYRALQQFFKWWSVEEDVPNPMAAMSPPMVPEQDPVVLRTDELKSLIKSCQGKEFVQRRDLAILYVFMDSGVRRAELAGMLLDDLDLDIREVRVRGKGRRDRTVAFGRNAAWALDRYVATRATQQQAYLPALWLGEKKRGAMTPSGIYQVVERRGAAVGIKGLHPHVLRHSWVDLMKRGGMAEDEIMRAAGWRSRAMLNRYAASTSAARALDTARRIAPGDRL